MDLGWTQARWTAFFEKLGILISAWYAAARIKELIGSAKITIDKYLDSERLTDWNLVGIVLGSNTWAWSRKMIWFTVESLFPKSMYDLSSCTPSGNNSRRPLSSMSISPRGYGTVSGLVPI